MMIPGFILGAALAPGWGAGMGSPVSMPAGSAAFRPLVRMLLLDGGAPAAGALDARIDELLLADRPALDAMSRQGYSPSDAVLQDFSEGLARARLSVKDEIRSEIDARLDELEAPAAGEAEAKLAWAESAARY